VRSHAVNSGLKLNATGTYFQSTHLRTRALNFDKKNNHFWPTYFALMSRLLLILNFRNYEPTHTKFCAKTVSEKPMDENYLQYRCSPWTWIRLDFRHICTVKKFLLYVIFWDLIMKCLKCVFFRIASLQKNLSLMCYDFDIATYVHQSDVKYLLI